jgi:hypothetical protein
MLAAVVAHLATLNPTLAVLAELAGVVVELLGQTKTDKTAQTV